MESSLEDDRDEKDMMKELSFRMIFFTGGINEIKGEIKGIKCVSKKQDRYVVKISDLRVDVEKQKQQRYIWGEVDCGSMCRESNLPWKVVMWPDRGIGEGNKGTLLEKLW